MIAGALVMTGVVDGRIEAARVLGTVARILRDITVMCASCSVLLYSEYMLCGGQSVADYEFGPSKVCRYGFGSVIESVNV